MGLVRGTLYTGVDGFLQRLDVMFAANISGWWGSGKTALAVELALRSVLSGRHRFIVSNVPLAFADPVLEVGPDDLKDCVNSVIIMDESWNFLESGQWKRAKDYVAFLRKQNCVMLLPSVLPVTSYVRPIVVERVFNGYPLGLPVWLYRWMTDPGDARPSSARRGAFFWLRPHHVFGLYDHRHKSGSEFWVYE